MVRILAGKVKNSGESQLLKWEVGGLVHLTLQHLDLCISRTELNNAYRNMVHGVLAKKDASAYLLSAHAYHTYLSKFDPQ
ncbi:hypothetical protein PsorP6_002523 [Peronosclerospora sorghi]|uniref:Uncharacterized protein n=1 Tax=Peronosclerospora sorghi TaxID=230839 RepID=A0ACC0WWG6_9STRA|nr:hypothetical protein PsorP6_002523 [Peronosclerospora sorghi]